jgi:uncharacterized protein
MSTTSTFLDPLYGERALSEEVNALARLPVMQRLRQIRLSNIDSVGMLGIANVSRYEHSAGTAILAGSVGFSKRLAQPERIILEAAALLHDSAIPPFGHLVEEMFEYVSAGVNHEERWSVILGDSKPEELGGLDLQIFMGRQANLWPWANRTFGERARASLKEILDTIKGQGKFGKCICGDVDLDNLDNVARAAFHMGLPTDRLLPMKIAERMVGLDATKGVIFAAGSSDLIGEWLRTRKQVYERFMLCRADFVGKIMLISAAIAAYKREYFTKRDWVLTDSAFINLLLDCKDKEVSEPVSSWLCSELWPLSDLFWMEGDAPKYSRVSDFSDYISTKLGRMCFAYCIKDKRTRELRISSDDFGDVSIGADPEQWLLGVGSSLRRSFTDAENKRLLDYACEFFRTEAVGRASGQESATLALFH